MAEKTPKWVLALSSEVGVGDVGLSIARFVFAGQQINAISLPTVLLASRPDLGTMSRFDVPVDILKHQLSALRTDGWFARLDGVMTGYFATAAQAELVAETLEQIGHENPAALIMVDPVLGDEDTGLYVEREVAAAVRDGLLPLADIITPNMFEFAFLTGERDVKKSELARFCKSLDVPQIVVTSASINKSVEVGAGGVEICTALVQHEMIRVFNSPFKEQMPKGTGDVFASYLLSSMINDNALKGSDGRIEKLARNVEKTIEFMEGVADRVQGSRTIAPYLLF